MWDCGDHKCMHASSVTQLCLTLRNPMDCSLLSCSVRGIFQARILEQVAVSSSRGSSWPRDWTYVCFISCTSRKIFFFFFFTSEPPLPTVNHYCLAQVVTVFQGLWITCLKGYSWELSACFTWASIKCHLFTKTNTKTETKDTQKSESMSSQ